MKYLKQYDVVSTYCGELTRTEDFDSYWEKQISLVQRKELKTELQETAYQYGPIKAERIVYHGLDDTQVVGWYIHAEVRQSQCIVTTHGFKSSRKHPHAYLHWVLEGYDVLVFDCRLQAGETGFNSPILHGSASNVYTINILDKDSCYFRHQYTDAMLAVKLMQEMGYTDIVLEGTSQAGGLALVVAALYGQVKAVLANVPSSSDIDQRILNATGSYKMIRDYLKNNPDQTETAMQVISYFDLKNMAERLTCPVYCSVGWLDDVCPAKNFYASYNRFTCPKELVVYPFSGHEGGSTLHTEKELETLKQMRKQEIQRESHQDL